jgi:hypothetical protein
VNRRGVVLGLALLASVAWSAWTLTAGPDDVVQATVRPRATAVRVAGHTDPRSKASANAPAEPAFALPLAQRPTAPKAPRNLFGAYSYEAPRPPPVALVPEPPRPPPLPFVFSGRLIVDGRATYLLLQGNKPISAMLGEDIGEFRLVEAAPERLVFLHGPTGQRVALSTGSAPVN